MFEPCWHKDAPANSLRVAGWAACVTGRRFPCLRGMTRCRAWRSSPHVRPAPCGDVLISEWDVREAHHAPVQEGLDETLCVLSGRSLSYRGADPRSVVYADIVPDQARRGHRTSRVLRSRASLQ